MFIADVTAEDVEKLDLPEERGVSQTSDHAEEVGGSSRRYFSSGPTSELRTSSTSSREYIPAAPTMMWI